jgi:4,5-dihydroxyphthalate decarboxylase
VRALLGSAPARAAVQTHTFVAGDVDLDLPEVNPVHRAFPEVLNGGYDVAELAIVAFLQGLDAGRSVTLLPVTLLGRFQHHCLVTVDPAGTITADGLKGKRVGVRSWSQTTAVWVRGFLGDDHGVDVSKVGWVVYESSHLAGRTDPPYVSRAPEGASLGRDLLAGDVDAAIMGNELPDDDRIRTLLPDPARAAAAWYGRTGAIPLNHMLVASDQFIAANPDVVAEMCAVVAESVPAVPRISSATNFYPVGFDALMPSLELAGRYAYEQGLISRLISADEIRAKTERLAGRSYAQVPALPVVGPR